MCGIAGFTGDERWLKQRDELLGAMLETMRHRGPDDRATYAVDNVGLGHARLSIIDLESGRQPLFSEDESVSLVCNGEIYNYRELRQELIAAGHRFRTNSDCEVLVHLWEEDGPAMLEKLRGMFAFVLYDRDKKTLFGARDHFGQKPLFYSAGKNRFAFASEIKALLPLPGLSRKLDVKALDQFLFYKYVPHPATLFRSVRELPPGHCFEYRDGTLDIRRYWEPHFEPDASLSEAEHLERLEAGLQEAVESHLVSDVPVGVFLSGGIDSSLITAMASRRNRHPLQTFSISFPDPKADESRFAEQVSRELQTEHQTVQFDPTRVRDCLETVGRIYDQPLADSAAMPVLYLSELAASQVKVVLTGDGGDEIFGGYRKYRRAGHPVSRIAVALQLERRMFATDRLAACSPDRWGLRKLRSRIGLVITPTQRCEYQRKHWEGWQRHALYQPAIAEEVGPRFSSANLQSAGREGRLHPLLAMLRSDQLRTLPCDYLRKTDYATMAKGLEARAPFLDPKLVQLAAKLPPHLLVTAKQTKVALREVARSWLPKKLCERPKKGFSFPIGQWFRNDLRTWVWDCLLKNSTTVPRYFRPDVVEQLLFEHNSGAEHTGRIYSLLSFELWHRNFAA